MPRTSSNLPQGQNLPTKPWFFDGFNLGVNNFSLATELAGNELSSAVNAELYGKRSIRPRRGSVRLGSQLGTSAVDGLFQYKEGAVNEILGISAGTLKKYNSSLDAWQAVTGGTFTAGLRTRGVKMRGNEYFGNGVDPFARYNGTLVATFTAVAAPAGLAVTPVGTTGVEQYVYEVTTVTDKGESLPSAPVTINNGNAILDATNKNSVSFTRRTESQVIGYNVYGRALTGNGVTLMQFIDQPASGATVTWVDDGTVIPQIWLPPDGDGTDGVQVTMWEQLRGSLVGAGDPSAPHRLFFSGTGTRYESFSPAHNGGWIDIRPGDNDVGINGLAPFESKIIIAKQRSIHQFLFDTTTGDALVQELITYVGCGAPGTMVVMENDVAFIDSELKMRILGYEPNFTAGIRTTSLSEGRVVGLFNDIDPNYMQNMEGIYHNGRYYLAATTRGSTTNDMVLVYDRRYLAFLGRWSGEDCRVRCWLVYDGKDRKQRLYAGGVGGYVYEFSTEGHLTNHDGSAVVTTIRTRNEDLRNSGQQKLWKWADLRLFQITGSLELKTILNGATTLDTSNFVNDFDSGWGKVRWGTMRWGLATGVGASANDLDKTYRHEIYELANSLQFEITKKGAQDDFILVSMRGEAFLLPTEVFDNQNSI